MHARQHRVEGAADLQQAQHPLQEPGQVFAIGETAVHIGDDLEFSKLLARILPQTFAGEILYAVIAEPRGLLSPLVRPAVFYGDCDRARLGAGPAALFSRRRIVFRCVIVEYGLALARSDIQPTVRAAEAAERVSNAGGKNLRVGRQPSVRNVAAENIRAPSAVDFFLLGELLVDPRLHRFLCPTDSLAERMQGEDDQHGQACDSALPPFR